MEFKNKKILVVGFGRSGLSAARYLIKKGAEITISDIKSESDLDNGLLKEFIESGVNLEIGEHRPESFIKADMIVLSPGVPSNIAPLNAARKADVPVVGEIELASRLFDTPVVAVTGTNGKTTVVSMLGEIIECAGLDLFVGGNIGTPLIDYVAEGIKADYVLVEVSSFQLDTIESFSPFVSLILNITPDHLDRYPDFDAYVRSKLNIFKNQGKGQYAVLNDDDPVLREFAPVNEVKVLRYGMEKSEEHDAFIHGDRLIARLPGGDDKSFSIRNFHLPGIHNLRNLMGAVLTAMCMGIDTGAIQKGLSGFKGLSHRIEHVARINGVDFYDDSKATNVDAAVKSIECFERPVILIAGGMDKGGAYDPLVSMAKSRVKNAVFMGEARMQLGNAFKNIIPFMYAEDMKDAVLKAFSQAEKGDVILLAPACSSFDMFSDYAHRGTAFRKEVEGLGNG